MPFVSKEVSPRAEAFFLASNVFIYSTFVLKLKIDG